jgi:F-type H+-transporting ATPase subunit gamma
VRALADYYRAVELGLGACLREIEPAVATNPESQQPDSGAIGAIVFGSDQGLVGKFNEVVAGYAVETLTAMSGKPQAWAVGERAGKYLIDACLPVLGVFDVPNSVKAIAPLIGQIQIESETHRARFQYTRLYVFHNRPQPGGLYEPVSQRLLPLDSQWQQQLAGVRWPTRLLPQVMCGGTATLRALIREYLFISLFRACAESLASENASRLAAMQRADKNIDELLENLHGTFHRLRQSTIDEELFDVIAGSDAIMGQRRRPILLPGDKHPLAALDDQW